MKVEPSKPGEPRVDQQASIPRSRDGAEEPLVGEVIPKGVPLGRPYVSAEPRAAAPAAAPKKGRRLRTAMIVIAALAVGLCLGGLGFGYLVYDRATTPDRSTPVIVVREYLAATFDQRDSMTAARFTCGDPAEIKDVQAFLKDLQERESRYNIHIQVSWDRMTESTSGTSGSVHTNLRIAVPESNGLTSESIQRWVFQLEQRSGWRVCDGHRVE